MQSGEYGLNQSEIISRHLGIVKFEIWYSVSVKGLKRKLFATGWNMIVI